MFTTSAKALKKPASISTMAIMIALYAALYLVKIPLALESRVSLTFIPVAVTAYLMGPVPAMLVGGLGDILGFLIFPSGFYFPGFTVSAVLSGAVYGACLYHAKNAVRLRVIISKVIITLLINIVLNTLWLAIMYEKAFFVYLTTRVVKNLILFPFQVIVTIIVLDILDRTGITKKYL